jgi:hypothetical protein
MINPELSRVTLKKFTIASGATQPSAAIDTGAGKVVGVLCGSSIGDATSMTFDVSFGTVATRDTPKPTKPGEAADYADALQSDGSTQGVTVTLSAGDYCGFLAADAAVAANWPQWVLPTTNASVGASAIDFWLAVRVY